MRADLERAAERVPRARRPWALGDDALVARRRADARRTSSTRPRPCSTRRRSCSTRCSGPAAPRLWTAPGRRAAAARGLRPPRASCALRARRGRRPAPRRERVRSADAGPHRVARRRPRRAARADGRGARAGSRGSARSGPSRATRARLVERARGARGARGRRLRARAASAARRRPGAAVATSRHADRRHGRRSSAALSPLRAGAPSDAAEQLGAARRPARGGGPLQPRGRARCWRCSTAPPPTSAAARSTRDAALARLAHARRP